MYFIVAIVPIYYAETERYPEDQRHVLGYIDRPSVYGEGYVSVTHKRKGDGVIDLQVTLEKYANQIYWLLLSA